jgi:hypothetical protein
MDAESERCHVMPSSTRLAKSGSSRLLLALAAAALLAASCGSDADVQASSTSAPVVESATTESMSEESMSTDEHEHIETVEIDHDVPVVSIDVTESDEGWSVQIAITSFSIVAEDAEIDNPKRQGHAHVYVDGVKLGRAYAAHYLIGHLSVGDHVVRVELSTHEHQVLTAGGEPIDVTTTIQVTDPPPIAKVDTSGSEGSDVEDAGPQPATGEPTAFDADPSTADVTIELEIREGVVDGGAERIEVEAGQVVALVIDSDALHEVHVHGYDVLRTIASGSVSVIAFTAEIPGVFEVELEGSHHPIVELLVR